MSATAVPAAETSPIPRQNGLPLLGNLLQIPKGRLIQYLTETSRSFDGIFELDFAGDRAVFVTSAELVAEICDEKRFRKALGPSLTLLRALGGDGLFTSRTNEENWGKAHRILMPAFGQRAMRSYFDTMLTVAQRLVDKWQRNGSQADIPVTDDMTRLTLDTIALCGFDYDFRSFENESIHPFIEAMVRSLAEALGRMTRLPVQNALRRGAQRQFDADNRYMHALVDEVIAQRRREPTGKTDLLNLMLEAKDPLTGERLDDVNIRYQVVTFLIAGHETTSGLLSFALYGLLRNPGILAQAYAEVDAVLPGDKVPVYADLARLDVIDRVLKETLRLWPTAPAFAVAPFGDTVIGQRYRLGKSQRLTVVIPALHRDPKVWTDPERFDIDRFLPENERRLPSHAYKPFGNGQRACIGRQFALTEAKLALALILQRFKLSDPHDYRFRIAETLTIKPDGFKLRASPRLPHERICAPPATIVDGSTGLPAAQGAAAVATSGAPAPQGQGRPMRVAYGTTLGTARDIATQIAQRAAQSGFDARLQTLDELATGMPHEGMLVVVSATYNGNPPDTARQFAAAMSSSLAKADLSGLQCAVFGCGNSQWPSYQDFPRQVAEFLERAGAKPLLPRGEADDNGDFDQDADAWLQQFWTTLDAATGEQAPLQAPVLIEYGDVLALRQPVLDDAVTRLQVLSNEELVSHPTGLWDFSIEAPRTSTRHLRLRAPAGQAPVRYQSGDHLAVWPSNTPDKVQAVVDRLGVEATTRLRLHSRGPQVQGLPVGTTLTIGELLTHFVELQEVPSRAALRALKSATRCPHTQQQLTHLSSDDPRTGYLACIATPRLTLLDLLERFPAIELTLEGWLALCPPMRPRLYSISSAAEANADELAITVGTVRGPALSGNGEFRGVASNFLASLSPGDMVVASVRTPSPTFAPVHDRPMVLIGPGTGIAPLRAFIEARAHRPEAANLPPVLLFHGCRHPDHDFLYREQMLEWQRQGLVSIRLAVSTDVDGQRFVQHAVSAAGDEVWALWEQGAVIYVCGDGRQMAPAVREALIELHRRKTGSDHATASAWLVEQMAAGRYRQDVFN